LRGDGCDQHCVASQAVRKPEKVPLKGEKGPLLAGFCNFVPVSELPNRRTHRPFREKSPVTSANIPVFRRLSLETGFDLHCARVAASISFGSPTLKILDWESADPLTAKRSWHSVSAGSRLHHAELRIFRLDRRANEAVVVRNRHRHLLSES
jgi:hypothetical protein